jgi:hypothetical protein
MTIKFIWLLPTVGLAMLLSGPVQAEAWSCTGVGTGVGTWKVQGNELISPPGDMAPVTDHFKIIKNDNSAVIAFMDTKFDRYELVMIDKHTLAMKLVALGINGDYEDRKLGKCKPASR